MTTSDARNDSDRPPRTVEPGTIISLAAMAAVVISIFGGAAVGVSLFNAHYENPPKFAPAPRMVAQEEVTQS